MGNRECTRLIPIPEFVVCERGAVNVDGIIRASKAIFKISFQKRVYGTGFIVSIRRDVNYAYVGLITCAHILTGINNFEECELQFEFVKKLSSVQLSNQICENIVKIDSLDICYLIIKKETLESWLGSEIGASSLELTKESTSNTKIYIMQHPEAGKLQAANGNMIKCQKRNEWFLHNMDTEKGSSGSPILTEENHAVGIHLGYVEFQHGKKFNTALKSEIIIREMLKFFSGFKDTQHASVESVGHSPDLLNGECVKRTNTELKNAPNGTLAIQKIRKKVSFIKRVNRNE